MNIGYIVNLRLAWTIWNLEKKKKSHPGASMGCGRDLA